MSMAMEKSSSGSGEGRDPNEDDSFDEVDNGIESEIVIPGDWLEKKGMDTGGGGGGDGGDGGGAASIDMKIDIL